MFAIVNHDADAGALVVGIEIVQVDQSDGSVRFNQFHHETELFRRVNVQMGVLDVFFQHVHGKRSQRVAHFPHVHVVFPLVEVFQIFGFQSPETNDIIIDHSRAFYCL